MTTINDLDLVQVEHLIGAATGKALVQVRCVGGGAVLLCQIEPDVARALAMDLLTSAARAEYELDLITGGRAAGMNDSAVAGMRHLVRRGELRRHTYMPDGDR